MTPIPTTSATIIVRMEMAMVAGGNAAPVALNSAVIPFDTPTPPKIPKPVAMMPMMSASPKIIRRICDELAPIARSNASSRSRWLMMMANVLKIRKALTKSEMAANPKRSFPKISMISLMAPAVSFADCSPGITSYLFVSRVAISFWTVEREAPFSRPT